MLQFHFPLKPTRSCMSANRTGESFFVLGNMFVHSFLSPFFFSSSIHFKLLLKLSMCGEGGRIKHSAACDEFVLSGQEDGNAF
jgi:hypothetical protein